MHRSLAGKKDLFGNQIPQYNSVDSTQGHTNAGDDEGIANGFQPLGEDHPVMLPGQLVIGAKGPDN